MIKKVGRPVKADKEKKVQVIFYVPKKNVKKFKDKVIAECKEFLTAN
jgi:hypothetical protein